MHVCGGTREVHTRRIGPEATEGVSQRGRFARERAGVRCVSVHPRASGLFRPVEQKKSDWFSERQTPRVHQRPTDQLRGVSRDAAAGLVEVSRCGISARKPPGRQTLA
jgi:hypothetical protein